MEVVLSILGIQPGTGYQVSSRSLASELLNVRRVCWEGRAFGAELRPDGWGLGPASGKGLMKLAYADSSVKEERNALLAQTVRIGYSAGTSWRGHRTRDEFRRSGRLSRKDG